MGWCSNLRLPAFLGANTRSWHDTEYLFFSYICIYLYLCIYVYMFISLDYFFCNDSIFYMIRTRQHCMLYYPTMLSKRQLYINWGELNVDCLWMCGDENWVPTWAMYTDICVYISIYLQGGSRDPNELWMYSYGAPLSRVLSHLQSTDLFSAICFRGPYFR